MHMRFVRHLASLVLFSLGACTSPTGSSSGLAGRWRTVAIPSGSGIDLSLTTTGELVTGTGHEYHIQYLADTLTVVGHEQLSGTFGFDVTFGSGASATYSGRLVAGGGGDQLDGTWTDAGQSPQSLTFYRQNQ